MRKDIRGFITNRLMYSMYREACYLVENGYATVEDVDRACRNNGGYWMTLVGVFGWMDLTGVAAYHTVMKDLLPTLNNQVTIPKLIDDIVKRWRQGISNGKGFYQYTPEEAKLWEETFTEFSYDIRQLALKYPADVVKRNWLRYKKPKNRSGSSLSRLLPKVSFPDYFYMVYFVPEYQVAHCPDGHFERPAVPWCRNMAAVKLLKSSMVDILTIENSWMMSEKSLASALLISAYLFSSNAFRIVSSILAKRKAMIESILSTSITCCHICLMLHLPGAYLYSRSLAVRLFSKGTVMLLISRRPAKGRGSARFQSLLQTMGIFTASGLDIAISIFIS